MIGVFVARRRQLDRASAETLVRLLHDRWFPDADGRPDEGYRVSMFEPYPSGTDIKQWRCIARTTSPNRQGCWPRTADPHAMKFGGLVNATGVTGKVFSVPGVPEASRNDQVELARYRRAAFVGEKEQKERSWKFATLLSLLARRPSGPILCILVVEREDGLPIDVKGRWAIQTADGTTFEDADVCGVELELAAAVWGAAWEDL